MTVPSKPLKELFLSVLEVAANDRAEWLDRQCAGDKGLREQLNLMLAAHDAPHSLLDPPAIVAPVATISQTITEKPGTQIGPYKLLQQIGEGGMGVVYMAEQKEPVKRRVALKIIKPGMDTRQVIARFEAERQALAMMDHPNIAKVLDAGATESGRPYFVMELVNGLPVTKYCDEQHLNPKERLQLFVPICQAVQHAHQKGIIHRDLKPFNILVAMYDNKAVPKIIDFGVAKATSQTLTEKTMFTQLGQIVGTLEYMSPEQAQRNQLDIDTRSDIYSLGVVLYELLTGQTPFDRESLRSAAFDEMLRIIREEEPSKPSTKVSSSQSLPSIAANRRIEPTKLGSMIRGELDWIVLKAMEKDRGQRYETASKFAEDVQHYLNDEAVVAGPPTAAYKFRKFARRNKAAIGTAAAIAGSLIIGSCAAIWQANQASKERNWALRAEKVAENRLVVLRAQKDEIENQKRRADVEAEKARTEAEISSEVTGFLNNDLLGMANVYSQLSSEISPDPDIKLRTVVDRAASRIDGKFHSRPLVEASIRSSIGRIYNSLGLYEKAEKQHQRALQIRRDELGLENSATLESLRHLAEDLGNQGRYHIKVRYDEAEQLLNFCIETQRRVLGEEHQNTLRSMSSLADQLCDQRRFDEAESLYQETLEIQRRVLGEEHPDTLASMHGLARVYGSAERFELAIDLFKKVLEVRRRTHDPRDPRTLRCMNCLAAYLSDNGKHREAENLHRQTLEMQEHVLGNKHPDVAQSLNNLGAVLSRQGKQQEAIIHFERAIEINPGDKYAHHNLGNAYSDLHKNEEAISEWRKAYSLDSKLPFAYLVWLLARDPHRPVADYAEALRIGESCVKSRPGSAVDWQVLGWARYRNGQWKDAIDALSKSIQLQGDGGDAHQWLFQAMAHWQLGERELAREWFDKSVFAMECRKRPNSERLAFRDEAEKLLGLSLTNEDRQQIALEWASRQLQVNPQDAKLLLKRGNLCLKLERYKEAETDFSRLVKLEPNDQRARLKLSLTVMFLHKYERVIDECSAAIRIGPDTAEAYCRRGYGYVHTGKTDLATADFAKAIELDPNFRWTYSGRGEMHGWAHEWQQALDDFQKYHRRDSANRNVNHKIALLLLATGDREGYHRWCADLKAQYDQQANPMIGESLLYSALAAPDGLENYSSLIRFAEDHSARNQESHAALALVAAARLRAGQTEAALAQLESLVGPNSKMMLKKSWLALARIHAGQPEEARELLDIVGKWLEKSPPTYWADYLENDLLHQEAEHLLDTDFKAVASENLKTIEQEKP